jgi:hypothetical protein
MIEPLTRPRIYEWTVAKQLDNQSKDTGIPHALFAERPAIFVRQKANKFICLIAWLAKMAGCPGFS